LPQTCETEHPIALIPLRQWLGLRGVEGLPGRIQKPKRGLQPAAFLSAVLLPEMGERGLVQQGIEVNHDAGAEPQIVVKERTAGRRDSWQQRVRLATTAANFLPDSVVPRSSAAVWSASPDCGTTRK
jgi:hypothetical protein